MLSEVDAINEESLSGSHCCQRDAINEESLCGNYSCQRDGINEESICGRYCCQKWMPLMKKVYVVVIVVRSGCH